LGAMTPNVCDLPKYSSICIADEDLVTIQEE